MSGRATTVRVWPALDSKKGKDVIVDSLLDAGHALRRSGFGPRLVYLLGGGDGNEELSTVLGGRLRPTDRCMEAGVIHAGHTLLARGARSHPRRRLHDARDVMTSSSQNAVP